MNELVIESDYIVTCNEKNQIIKDGALYIKGDKILDVGTKRRIHQDYSAGKIIEGKNKILIPGLVNTHAHSVQSLLRGKGDDLSLLDWLRKVVLIGECNFSPDEVYTSSLVGFSEMIRTGTTTCNDLLTTHDSEKGIQAAIQTGIRTRIGRMLMDLNVGFPDDMISDTEEIVSNLHKHINKFHNIVEARIKYSLNPRFLLSCSANLMTELNNIKNEYEDIMIHTHASENKKECKEVKQVHGMSYIRKLKELNILGKDTILAHGIWLDNEEYQLIKNTDTRISHNPSSNAKLASGICDVVKYKKMGVKISLATDGAPCNNNLDMFREMRLATFLQKLKHLNEKALPANETLRMATIEGAKSINWASEIGSIEPNKKADLALIDITDVNALPMYNPISHLVYSAEGKDVWLTMINGKIIFKDGDFKTINYPKLVAKVKKYQEKWD